MSSEQNKLRANPMKLLLVGSGNIASTYLNAVRNVPEVKITGIVSRSGKVPSNAPEGIKVYPSITEAKLNIVIAAALAVIAKMLGVILKIKRAQIALTVTQTENEKISLSIPLSK